MRRRPVASPATARRASSLLLAATLSLGLGSVALQTLPAAAAVSTPGRFTAVTAVPGPGVGEVTVSWTQDGSNTTGYSLETGLTSFSTTSTSLPDHGRGSQVFDIPAGRQSVTLTAAQVASAGAPVASANHLYYRLHAVNHTSAGDADRFWPYLQTVAVQPAVPASDGVHLRAGTFNIRTARATTDSQTWLERVPAVAQTILDHHLGVLAMQELGPGRADGQTGTLQGHERQTSSLLRTLGSLGGERYKLVRTTPYVSSGTDTGTQGMRILYDSDQYSLVTSCPETSPDGNYSPSCSIKLPLRSTGDTENDRRRAAYAEFEDKASGTRFYYVSVHLDARHSSTVSTEKTYDALRAAQIETTTAYLDKIDTEGVPVMLGGDFNTWQNNSVGYSAHDSLIADGYYDLAASQQRKNIEYSTMNDFETTMTKSSSGFGSRLDVVAVKGAQGSSYWENVMKVTDDQRPSDHDMVVTDVTLPMAAKATPTAYQPLTPARVLDTRSGVGADTGAVAGGDQVDVQVTGEGGVPTSGVSAVVLNVTATQALYPGHATVFPTGSARPDTSTLSYAEGQAVANGVIVKVGDGGKIRLYASQTTQLVADVQGWFPTGSDLTTVTPSRVLDTRSSGAVAAGSTQDVQVGGQGGVPSSGVSSVVLSVTATGTSKSGYLTAFPNGVSRPTSSSLNFRPDQAVTNQVVVKTGDDGKVSLYASADTQLVVDVLGWFPTGSDLTAVTPARVLDTRSGVGADAGVVPTGGRVDVQVAGQGGVPTGATAVVLNVTATQETGSGYATVYPTGVSRPKASTLNFVAGQSVANQVIVKLGDGGQVSLYASTSTHLVADVVAYIS